MSVLYISYDGMLEPLGQSQVLAYLEQLVTDRSIHLISYEKARDWQDAEAREAIRSRLVASGIEWHPLRYHKRFSIMATAWDIVVGTVFGLTLAARHRLRVVHARSYVAGIMALALKRMMGVRFLFDMRGFWVDERVDGGMWRRESLLFRIAKRVERHLLLGADHVVSLTHAGIRELQKFEYMRGHMPPTTVIPTCADLTRFHPGSTRDRGRDFVVGFVGTVGTWYLLDPMLCCFKMLRRLRPEARLRILNRDEHDFIGSRVASAEIPPEVVDMGSVSHSQMAYEMAQMDVAIFFIKPCFSKQGSSPTKLAEFLGCGIPCLSNDGVGDMTEILRGEGVGVAVGDFSETSLETGVRELVALCEVPGIQGRCVEVARKHFSLRAGVTRYDEIYRLLEN